MRPPALVRWGIERSGCPEHRLRFLSKVEAQEILMVES